MLLCSSLCWVPPTDRGDFLAHPHCAGEKIKTGELSKFHSSDNFNIWALSVLIYNFFFKVFSPCELRYSWFFIHWVILDCIISILNVMLWDSRSFLNPMDDIDIFVLVDNWAKWLRLQVLLVVVSQSVVLLRSLFCAV